MHSQLRPAVNSVAIHTVLLLYTALALFPFLMIVLNSLKDRRGVFLSPLALPNAESYSTEGYERLFENADFLGFFINSVIVTLVSLFFVLLLGAMLAWALSEYRFRGRVLLMGFVAIGIMIPIRLGSVSILELMVQLDLVNTLWALILVYIAQGLPLSVLILSEFMRQVPLEIKEAARCDDISEYRVFFQVVLPLCRPAMASVAVFTMIPVWNDLWFPLILAPGEETQTLTLGVQQFIGQYQTDWNAVLSALSLAVVPVLVLYFIFSRQLIRGLTSGAVK